MASDIDIGDVGRLEALAGAVRAAAVAGPRALADGEADVSGRLQRIERKVLDAREKLRRAQAMASEAEEDDSEVAQRQVDDAADHLHRVERAARAVQEALGGYRHAARAFRDLTSGGLKGAGEFLNQKLEAVRAYQAIRLEGTSSPATQSRGSDIGAPAPSIGGYSGPLPELPQGFAWIPIDQIVGEPGSGALEWKKGVSRDTMETGLRAFADQIVPRLRQGPVDRDALHAIDQAQGRTAGGLMQADNLSNLYEVVFGSDSIAASPREGGGFTLASGRHRTEVARSLGWTHVPARRTDLPHA